MKSRSDNTSVFRMCISLNTHRNNDCLFDSFAKLAMLPHGMDELYCMSQWYSTKILDLP